MLLFNFILQLSRSRLNSQRRCCGNNELTGLSRSVSQSLQTIQRNKNLLFVSAFGDDSKVHVSTVFGNTRVVSINLVVVYATLASTRMEDSRVPKSQSGLLVDFPRFSRRVRDHLCKFPRKLCISLFRGPQIFLLRKYDNRIWRRCTFFVLVGKRLERCCIHNQ